MRIPNFEEQFLAFAKAKPADEAYNAGDWDNCAVAQFVRAQGADYTTHAFNYAEGDSFYNYPLVVETAAFVHAPNNTWGSLVERLEAFKAAGAF